MDLAEREQSEVARRASDWTTQPLAVGAIPKSATDLRRIADCVTCSSNYSQRDHGLNDEAVLVRVRPIAAKADAVAFGDENLLALRSRTDIPSRPCALRWRQSSKAIVDKAQPAGLTARVPLEVLDNLRESLSILRSGA